MVVLSAAVTNKAGKALVSRQFVPMNRIRIEGLLAAFPKLLGTESEHTFVETNEVRYIYYPLDQLYLLLITNKQSNIMEDLETLRLLAQVVPEYCMGHTEGDVVENAFELVFAFDEVISIGIKENVTMEQIRTFTEMDSHEEKLQKIIMESKFNEAREAARRKAKEMDKQKSEMRKMQGRGGGGYPGQEAYGSSGGNSRYGGGGGDGSSYSGGGGSSYGNSSQSNSSASAPSRNQRSNRPSSKKPSGPKPKGMQLGKASKKKDDFFAAMSKEEKLSGPRAPVVQVPGEAGISPDMHDKVFVGVEEKLTLLLEKEGGIKKLDLKGEMKITIFDPDDAKIVIQTSGALSKADGFKCRLHPKIDSKRYEAEGVLGLKDPSRPFPVGSENAPVVLRWRMQSSDESEIPFTLNVWPNSEDGRSVVSVEFEHNKEGMAVQDVVITIPCASQEPPEVTQIHGEFHYDHKEQALVWQIPEISADENNGTLEFSVPEIDDDDFFPVTIQMTSPDTYAGLEVIGVQGSETGEEHEFNARVGLVADKFTIE